MYVYITSDIHLECQDEYNLNQMLDKPDHPNSILVCCGDMCSIYLFDKLKRFFEYASKLYKYIIYVPGNCEYYKPRNSSQKPITFSQLNHKLDSISTLFDNVHILIDNCIIINDYLITGSILWSRINYDLPSHFRISGFNKDIYNRKNKQSISYIKNQIEYADTNKLKHLVITHYPPSKECLLNTNLKKDKYKTMYYNNLDGLFNNNLTWIYGHCHHNKNFKIDNTHLVSNQYGKNSMFDPNFSNKFFIII
jgi:predicted phosphodiesterase